MRIFVTGATGFIGSAVIEELLSAGHQVIGLTRTDDGAKKLCALGAVARVGTLDQVDILSKAAADSDGVIHTAFIHGFQHMNLQTRLRLILGAFKGGIMSSFMRTISQAETRALEAIGKALEGSGRPLVVTSGILSLPPGQVATESDSHVTGQPSRSFSEKAALAFVPRGVKASVVRLPPTVHGQGDHGFIPNIIQSARKRGIAAYIGDGSNRWPAVHRLDAARLFRLAVETREAGAIYHGVAETGFPFRDIASKIGSKLSLPTISCSPQQSSKYFGFLANFVALDNPASSQRTRDTLGWAPRHPGLFADLDSAGYFTAK